MTDEADSSSFKGSTRGDAAWQEARDRIASRNAEARTAGKAERETYEREREAMKQASAAARRAGRPRRRSG